MFGDFQTSRPIQNVNIMIGRNVFAALKKISVVIFFDKNERKKESI